ncbi:MAG: putative toxin-antitoxin system toxin component, PIN family [Defluviitaleaceae bacterium]|nr:putative toxin-antitoxin system toxin component, PIN family [Defluviitaleaceae bacterium]
MNKTRIVIDTNVIVSALLSRNGNPAKILDRVLVGELIIVYSEEILEEYEDVLYRPKLKISYEDADTLIADICLHGEEVWPTSSLIPMPDEDDRCFYDAAKMAGVYLVTGNAKHYPVDSFIVAPADFVKLKL